MSWGSLSDDSCGIRGHAKAALRENEDVVIELVFTKRIEQQSLRGGTTTMFYTGSYQNLRLKRMYILSGHAGALPVDTGQLLLFAYESTASRTPDQVSTTLDSDNTVQHHIYEEKLMPQATSRGAFQSL